MGDITGPKNCGCSKEYVPVECANGEAYENQCLADCAGAKECKLICDGKSHSFPCFNRVWLKGLDEWHAFPVKAIQ